MEFGEEEFQGNERLAPLIRQILVRNAKWKRNLNRLKFILVRLAFLNHLLIFIYMASTNLPVVLQYCTSDMEDLILMSLLGFGLYSNGQLIRHNSSLYYAIFNLFVALGISYRMQTIKRITRYDLYDYELDFYGGFRDKLYAIGECVIGYKISVALGYINLIVGTLTLAYQLFCHYLVGI